MFEGMEYRHLGNLNILKTVEAMNYENVETFQRYLSETTVYNKILIHLINKCNLINTLIKQLSLYNWKNVLKLSIINDVQKTHLF